MASEIANIDLYDDEGNALKIDNMNEPLEL